MATINYEMRVGPAHQEAGAAVEVAVEAVDVAVVADTPKPPRGGYGNNERRESVEWVRGALLALAADLRAPLTDRVEDWRGGW